MKGGSAKWRREQIVALSGAVIFVLFCGACTVSMEANCRSDDDCSAEQICLGGGGIVVRDGVCVDDPAVPDASPPQDTTVLEDTASERDIADADATVPDAFGCPPPLVDCGGECVDLDSDRDHCGGCGLACDQGRACEVGVCSDDCLSGYFECGDVCVDLQTDLAHCGGCNQACELDQSCSQGLCCDDGLMVCDGACVDPLSNSTHCGECGNGCELGCVDGQCDEFVQISAGGYHTCVRLAGGSVWCWGSNDQGQLGDGTGIVSSTPVAVEGVEDAVHISAGRYHSCVVLEGGAVKCWGDNSFGALGEGSQPSPTGDTPVEVEGITDAVGVSAGRSFSCAVLDDGTARCWGRNNDGALGDGTIVDSEFPVEVQQLESAVQIDCGNANACARLDNGNIRCWGRNEFGQLGDGTTTDRQAPVTVVGLSGAVDISVSRRRGHDVACSTLQSGEIECWGRNNNGQLGVGMPIDNSSTPVTVVGVSTGTEVVAGNMHVCAIAAGAVRCWGLNNYGQLGDGSDEQSFEPTEVLGISDAIDISAGYRHSCAIAEPTEILCWGWNDDGQLGDGTFTDETIPVPVQW